MMTPAKLMIIGAIVSAVCLLISAISDNYSFVFLAFCGGAVFGKGYGIWEERNFIRKDVERR